MKSFLNLLERYRDQNTVFESPREGALYRIETVDESGATVERLNETARTSARCTESLLDNRLNRLRESGGRAPYRDLDETSAVRATLLQADALLLEADRSTVILAEDDAVALPAICESLQKLRVSRQAGLPRLYKPAMLDCVLEAIQNGELNENKISFDWIRERFIHKMGTLGVDVDDTQAGEPFFALHSDLLWLLCYRDAHDRIERGIPGRIREKVSHACLKETFWRVAQNPAALSEMRGALKKAWWPATPSLPLVGSNGNGETIKQVHRYIRTKGFVCSLDTLRTFYAAIRSKPFVIMAGMSGTGKSRLVRLFAAALGATPENGRFQMIPVRPDWNDSSDLIGYFDLEGKFQPGALISSLLSAKINPGVPYFVCLDEMNLARVEHYFSDFLSIVESRRWENGAIVTDPILSESQLRRMDERGLRPAAHAALERLRVTGQAMGLPDNLYMVGTVNMDETTQPFSRKVLDRANTLEFNEVTMTDGLTAEDTGPNTEPVAVGNGFLKAEFLNVQDLARVDLKAAQLMADELENLNGILAEGNFQVGYRVRDESAVFYKYATDIGLTKEAAMEGAVLQKVLPRIQGSSQHVGRVLAALLRRYGGGDGMLESDDPDFLERLKGLRVSKQSPRLVKKLAGMLSAHIEEGFTSFWIV